MSRHLFFLFECSKFPFVTNLCVDGVCLRCIAAFCPFQLCFPPHFPISSGGRETTLIINIDITSVIE